MTTLIPVGYLTKCSKWKLYPLTSQSRLRDFVYSSNDTSNLMNRLES